MIYADTSALGRIYFADEEDHNQLRLLLLDDGEQVVSSQLARLEIASAAARAERAGRLSAAGRIVAAFDAHCGAGGPFTLLRLQADRIFESAHELVVRHGLRALDAMHLAVALGDAGALADTRLLFVTRDAEQAAAARAEGLSVA